MKGKTGEDSPPLVSTGTGGSVRRRGEGKRSKRYPHAKEKVLPPRGRKLRKTQKYPTLIE